MLLCYLQQILVSVMQVGGLMKNLPSVAALTAERDGEIRKAALNTLATTYKNLGMDPCFSYHISLYAYNRLFDAFPIEPFS